ncbi:MAG: hypothetical protein ACSHX9_17050 [Luteolibacter sp.]
MKIQTILTPLCAAFIASASSASAAITWLTPVSITGNVSDISTEGTDKYAYAINNSDTTVNGVVFSASGTNNSAQNFGMGNVTATTLTGYTAGAYTGGAAEPWNSVDASYKQLLQGGIFTGSGAQQTITLGNLTDGLTYQVQVWFNDSRSGRDNRENTLNGTNDVTVDYTPVNTAGGLGQYVIGTFVASGTTEALLMTSSPGTPQLNAIQVRTIPEPSVCLLGGLGILVMLRRKRD